MKALITGASSGIGRDIARRLAFLGYDLILVARREDKLEELKKEFNTNVKIVVLDLQNEDNCKKLYKDLKSENIDMLINNAGFGVHGFFYKTSLNKELEMIDVNIKALHILSKLFLNDFKAKDKGYILNVASSAAFLSGPLMASYYASKAYVLRLTTAIHEELKKSKSNVVISCLCPGAVDTEFNKVANVNFSVKPLTSKYVANYAIKKLLQKQLIIIPGFLMKFELFFQKFLPIKMVNKITYGIQIKKFKKKK